MCLHHQPARAHARLPPPRPRLLPRPHPPAFAPSQTRRPARLALVVDSVIYMFLPIIFAVLLRALQAGPGSQGRKEVGMGPGGKQRG